MQFVAPAGHAVTGLLPVTLQPMPAQQGWVSEHDWPSCEQVPAPPQVPWIDPGKNVQVSPLQQSAALVQAPVALLQPVPQ
ncbi:MAG: hypothetical protein JWO36_2511 [Myxococcales bacterium]|nr:hypothetical protein [Myxococcales bacterium]